MSMQGGQYLFFHLEERKFALPLDRVERVVQAAEVTPLPKAPEIVMGLINLKGSILPVLDLHRRFGLSERQIEVSDHFVIARIQRRRAALRVTVAIGVRKSAAKEVTAPEEILPGIEHLSGVIPQEDGTVLIQDLDRLLSGTESKQLNQAMKAKAAKKQRDDSGDHGG